MTLIDDDAHWKSLKHPLCPNEDDVDTFRRWSVGKVLLLGCTKELLPICDSAIDLVKRYDDPKISVCNWLEHPGADTVISDGGVLCFDPTLTTELLKYYSTRCNRFISRVFNYKLPGTKYSVYFPQAKDFVIPPSVSITDYDYTFRIWLFK